ncbi:M16 family metallopeptidase [Vibrio proteolyticus]|uniref:Peptidase M16 family protein n=1 Tax=Vibrio proteolyticus NBRC 13287 TaxID=1219065 RepID=U2ZJT3_VIBPR|nr:insulinase family protein [Vibrio proteolyticus]GAD68016.1 peptidase M16 family protein [Vibrio proteolyticus NBRC 13287]
MWNARFKKRTLLLSLSCLSFSVLSAPNDSALWFPQTDLPLDSRYQTQLLDNGMRLIVIRNDQPKNSVSLRMRVDAGSLQESGAEPGVAHFLEHMAFNGSTHVPEGEMVAMLERHGLSFGADTNAFTDFSQTVYELDLPKSDQDSIDTALFLLRETASELTLDKDAIARERKVIESEVRERQSANFERYIDWSNYLLAGSGIMDKRPLGTLAGMEAVNQKRLKDFYTRYYAPRNTTLIIAGDVETQAILQRVKHYFSDWKNPQGQDAAKPDMQVSLPQHAQAKAFIHPNITARIELNFVDPAKHIKATTQTDFDQWVKEIGDRALAYRLETIAFDSEGKLISPYAGTELDYQLARISQLSLTTAQGEWQQGLEALEQTLRQALIYGFSEEEVQRQVSTMANNLQLSLTATDDLTNANLVSRAVTALNGEYVLTSALFDHEQFNQKRDKITAQLVNEKFKQRWGAHPPRIYLADRQAPDSIESKLLAAYQNSQKEPVLPYVNQVNDHFGYESFGESGIAKHVSTSDYGNVVRYRFDNGVMLNVKPTKLEKDTVYLTVRIGTGKYGLSNDKAPLMTLFDAGMVAAGLKKHTLNELRGIFDDETIGANMLFTNSAIDAQSIVANKDVLNQLRLYAAYFTDGGYREEGRAFALQHLDSVYNTYQQSPEQVLQFHVGPLLHGGDARWKLPGVTELSQYSMGDVQPLVRDALLNGPVEIGVVGDITLEDATSYVAQTFGALPLKPQQVFEPYKESFPPVKKQDLTLYHQGDKTTAIATTYWQIPDGKNYEQSVGFRVLFEVLQQRITKEVREAIGASYSPWVDYTQSTLFKNYGNMSINSNTTVGQVDTVLATYKSVLRDLQARPVSEDDLRRAVTPMLDAIKQHEQDNYYWLDLTSIAQTAPEFLPEQARLPVLLHTMTREKLQKLAKLIDVDEALQIRVIPQP